MKCIQYCLITASFFILAACLEGQHKTTELSDEDIHARQIKAYEDAAADPRQFKADLKENCPHFGNALLTTEVKLLVYPSAGSGP